MAGIIPPWGCPWHGLIKGSKLELPNGSTIPFRQPAGSGSLERGSTSLIDLGAPGIPNGEQPDPATNKKWLNQAILSDQIHGVKLPSGAWVYQSPDSSLWLVTTSLHGSSGVSENVTVKLVRFGEFGREKEEYTYTIPGPNVSDIQYFYWGHPNWNHWVDYIELRKWCSHPKGHSAVFSCSGLPKQAPSSSFVVSEELVYIAWFEITLSGSADACVISCDQIYADKMLPLLLVEGGTQESGKDDVKQITNITNTTKGYPDCSGSYKRSVSFSAAPDSYTPASEYTSIIGMILAPYYTASGERRAITADYTATTTRTSSFSVSSGTAVHSYDVVEHASGEACEIINENYTSASYSDSSSLTESSIGHISIRANGVLLFSESLSTEKVTTKTTRAEFDSSGDLYDFEYNTTGSQRVYFDGNLVKVRGVDETWGQPVAASLLFGLLGGVSFGSGGREVRKKAFAMSNNTVSIRSMQFDQVGEADWIASYPKGIATPQGAIDASEIEYRSFIPSGSIHFYHAPVYTSYNPITQAVARDIETPINWT